MSDAAKTERPPARRAKHLLECDTLIYKVSLQLNLGLALLYSTIVLPLPQTSEYLKPETDSRVGVKWKWEEGRYVKRHYEWAWPSIFEI